MADPKAGLEGPNSALKPQNTGLFGSVQPLNCCVTVGEWREARGVCVYVCAGSARVEGVWGWRDVMTATVTDKSSINRHGDSKTIFFNI